RSRPGATRGRAVPPARDGGRNRARVQRRARHRPLGARALVGRARRPPLGGSRAKLARRGQERGRAASRPRAHRSWPSSTVGEVPAVTAYNYEHFDLYVESGQDEREFGAFPNMLHAGERALDGELTLLDGERVRLPELWRERGVVLEFGSFT